MVLLARALELRRSTANLWMTERGFSAALVIRLVEYISQQLDKSSRRISRLQLLCLTPLKLYANATTSIIRVSASICMPQRQAMQYAPPSPNTQATNPTPCLYTA